MGRDGEDQLRADVWAMMVNGVHTDAQGSDGETLTASGMRRDDDNYIELTEQQD